MVKIISIILCAIALYGCDKTINIHEALNTIQKVSMNSPELYELKWYDTGETCKAKLGLANSQIIRMDNKLYTIEKQLDSLQEATQ